MKWRVIPLQENNAYMNMAVDEAFIDIVKESKIPVIRFYKWTPSAISIGYFQSIKEEVNLQKCREFGVDVVRRTTGGGAVYHSHYGEITYSVIASQNLFPKEIIESYRTICTWVIKSLKYLNIDAQFVPINDIVAGGKKISGNGQTRKKGILLQHGTVLYDVNLDEMFSMLNVPSEKMKDKIIQIAKERVTSVTNFGPISIEELYDALVNGFTYDKLTFTKEITKEEIDLAEEIMVMKYLNKDWNYRI